LDEFHQVVLVLYGFFKQFDSETSTRADTWVTKTLHRTWERVIFRVQKLNLNPEYLERFFKVFLCKYVLGVSFELGMTAEDNRIKTAFLKQTTLRKVIEFTKSADQFLAKNIIGWFDENVEGNLLGSDSPDDIQNDEMLAEVWKKIHNQSVLWLLQYGDPGFREVINICSDHLDKFTLVQPFRQGMSVSESLKARIFDEQFCREIIRKNRPLKKEEVLILEKLGCEKNGWCEKQEIFELYVEGKVLRHAIRVADELRNYPTKTVLMYKNNSASSEIVPAVLDSVYNFLLGNCEISYSDRDLNVTDKTIVLVLQITDELFSSEVMLCLQEKLLQDVENHRIIVQSKNSKLLFWHDKSPEIILTLLINAIHLGDAGVNALNQMDVQDDETIAFLRVNCGLDMVGDAVDERHYKNRKKLKDVGAVARCLAVLQGRNDSFEQLVVIKKFSHWYTNVPH